MGKRSVSGSLPLVAVPRTPVPVSWDELAEASLVGSVPAARAITSGHVFFSEHSLGFYDWLKWFNPDGGAEYRRLVDELTKQHRDVDVGVAPAGPRPRVMIEVGDHATDEGIAAASIVARRLRDLLIKYRGPDSDEERMLEWLCVMAAAGASKRFTYRQVATYLNCELAFAMCLVERWDGGCDSPSSPLYAPPPGLLQLSPTPPSGWSQIGSPILEKADLFDLEGTSPAEAAHQFARVHLSIMGVHKSKMGEIFDACGSAIAHGNWEFFKDNPFDRRVVKSKLENWRKLKGHAPFEWRSPVRPRGA